MAKAMENKPKRNSSPAVWAQRQYLVDKVALDDFPTPPWATRALMEFVLPKTNIEALKIPVERAKIIIWEPAANRGHMTRPLKEYFTEVVASDIFDYESGYALNCIHDFLSPAPPVFDEANTPIPFRAIITNPPFIQAAKFIKRAFLFPNLLFAAFFVRTAFLEGKTRYFDIFKDNPPDIVAPFVERVSLVPGTLDKNAALATSYCWFVWVLDKPKKKRAKTNSQLIWIPPCRRLLERDSDYL